LVDELDRCDPDEAFSVIKQMRVLFAMRRVPVAFILCANPEPIGLAIKHRYGLESDTGDYEARRILEKFVDGYEDFLEPVPLGKLIKIMWCRTDRELQPWVLAVDDANPGIKFEENVVKNATGYDAMTTTIAAYSNLRVLKKSFDYVLEKEVDNKDLLWTIWHLEIIAQIDPRFRRAIRMLAGEIEEFARSCYEHFTEVNYVVGSISGKRQIDYVTDEGKTLFAIFRSHFWNLAKSRLKNLQEDLDPQSCESAKLLGELLVEPHRVDFVVLLSLLPFSDASTHSEISKENGTLPFLAVGEDEDIFDRFGDLLASY